MSDNSSSSSSSNTVPDMGTGTKSDLTKSSLSELQTWIRKPVLYGVPIFDILVILLLVHWTYSYITYITLFLIMIYIQKCMGLESTKTEVPMILSRLLGWSM